VSAQHLRAHLFGGFGNRDLSTVGAVAAGSVLQKPQERAEHPKSVRDALQHRDVPHLTTAVHDLPDLGLALPGAPGYLLLADPTPVQQAVHSADVSLGERLARVGAHVPRRLPGEVVGVAVAYGAHRSLSGVRDGCTVAFPRRLMIRPGHPGVRDKRRLFSLGGRDRFMQEVVIEQPFPRP